MTMQTKYVDITLTGVDVDDDIVMDELMGTFPECSFMERSGAAGMSILCEDGDIVKTVENVFGKLSKFEGITPTRVQETLATLTDLKRFFEYREEHFDEWVKSSTFPAPLGEVCEELVWSWEEVHYWLVGEGILKDAYFAPLTQVERAQISLLVARFERCPSH